MLGVASGSILVPLNSTMLAVALPGVMSEFGLGAASVTSLVSLYLGAVAIATPLGGALGDRFGARRVFLAGVLGFGAASLVAAAATAFELLEASRVLQALSGALLSTSSAALIRETAPADRRGEAFGLFDLLVSTSAAVGPFIGGVIVALFGWRAMFFLAAPIALVSAVLVGVLLRPKPHDAPKKPTHHVVRGLGLDLPGLVLLGLTISAFLIALRATGDTAASSASGPTFATVAAIAVVPLLVLFVLVELRTQRPAVDPRLFRRRPFAAAVAGVFGSTVVLHGSFILVPLAVEELLRESPTTSGIALLGIAGVAAVVAPFGGRFSDTRGRRIVVVTGSAISAVGLLFLALPAGASSAVAIGLLLGIVGLGNGLTSPRQAAALETVEPARVGMAAGTYYTGRYLGGVLGASLAGAVLGGAVTGAGVSLGFGLLTLVAVGIVVASFGLPGRRA
jgi:EmrB/QacA subfamily drug resistance transporter